MMRHYSVFRAHDGIFTGDQFASTIEGHHLLNIPPGCEVIEGRHDHHCKRVERTGDGLRVIDWRPPAPSADHVWSADRKRWTLSAEAADKERKRVVARARITEIEAAQARRVRELLAQDDERLRAMDQEISALRADL